MRWYSVGIWTGSHFDYAYRLQAGSRQDAICLARSMGAVGVLSVR